VARAVDPSDGIDPSDESVEIDTADDLEFAEGFEVFDPDDEQPDLTDDEDVIAAANTVVEEPEDVLVIPADDTQFDSDDSVGAGDSDDDSLIEDEVEGVRGTEFVCLSCYLAKRRTQLADKKRSLCIDCV